MNDKIEPGKKSDDNPKEPKRTGMLPPLGSDKKEPGKKSSDNPKEPKYTGLLPSLDDDGGVSSSRRLDFALAVERVTDSYRNSDHLLMVYFPQRAEPFLFADTDAIIIGRTAGQNVDLDTTAFHGRELGVSRQHAEIVYENGAYYVRDLKSTNGSWLNTERLAPLQRYPIEAGDQLRLGHCLMILFVRNDKS